MDIDDDFDTEPEFPQKLLDKKAYVRVNPETGEPELIRVEPMVNEDGEVLIDTMIITIDDGPEMVMERDAAQQYIEDQKCSPLELTSHWKHRQIH